MSVGENLEPAGDALGAHRLLTSGSLVRVRDGNDFLNVRDLVPVRGERAEADASISGDLFLSFHRPKKDFSATRPSASRAFSCRPTPRRRGDAS